MSTVQATITAMKTGGDRSFADGRLGACALGARGRHRSLRGRSRHLAEGWSLGRGRGRLREAGKRHRRGLNVSQQGIEPGRGPGACPYGAGGSTNPGRLACCATGAGGGLYAGGGNSYFGTSRGSCARGASPRGTVISPVSPNSDSLGSGSSSRTTGTVIDPVPRSGSASSGVISISRRCGVVASLDRGRAGAEGAIAGNGRPRGGAIAGIGACARGAGAGIPAAGEAARPPARRPRRDRRARRESPSSSSSASGVASPTRDFDDIICVAPSSSSSISLLIGPSPSRPRARTTAPPTQRSSPRSP